LLDSLADIERDRNAFGAVGGVDPVYLSLTSRANAIGRQIQGIADAKRGEVRGKLALIRPTPAPVVKPVITVDTIKLVAQRATAQQNYATAMAQLGQINQKNARIDRESAHARELANVGAPPWAMLAAALVLALAVGFAASFGTELKRPHIADPREAEQISGARVCRLTINELARNCVELRHDRSIEPNLEKPFVDLAVPATCSSSPPAEATPDRLGIYGSPQIRKDRRRIMNLVGGTNPTRRFARA
jgi:hypothetical protein